MANLSKLVRRARRAVGLGEVPPVDAGLAGTERVFRGPPLTPELAAAIKLISPHCEVTATEEHRLLWETDQNGACWAEYEALAPLFRSVPKPARVLEIGPGMGRSLVFFSKKLGWEASEVHAYEGDGRTTKYTRSGPRFEDSFCGDISALQQVLEFNGVGNVTIFNARDVRLADMPGPYDLLYSFYSIGYRWSLEHFFDDLLPLLHDRSIAVFTVPHEFRPFPKLERLPHGIVDRKAAWLREKLLVISKEALPRWA